MRSPSLFLAIVSVALAPLAEAGTRILFSCDKEDITNRWDLYSIKPDGTDLKRITRTTARSEWAAALAPDGHRIAFVDNRGNNSNLYLTDLDGSTAVSVPITNRAMCVQWADDDTLYYFADIPGGSLQRFQIWQVNLDGSGQTRVYNATYDIFPTGADSFQFHQPSGRLYFTARIPINNPSIPYSGLPASSTFDTTYARCTDPTFQPGQLDDHYDLVRSPDGKWIAYAADFFDGNHRMYVRDAGGSCATQLRLSSGFTGDPHWAPDSSWLVFTRATSSSFGSGPYIGNLYTVNPDASSLTNRTGGISRVSGRCAHALVYNIVPAPFEIDSITLVKDGTKLDWTGVEGAEYTVEFSDNLFDWAAIPGAVATAISDGPVTYTDTSAGKGDRFYRIVGRCP